MWKQYTLSTFLAFAPAIITFAQNETSELQQILPTNRVANSEFGRSICMSGEKMIVGATFDNGLETHTGAAYIYRWDGSEWIEEQKLFASDGFEHQVAGFAVAMEGEVAVFSAPFDDDQGWGTGAVYIFRFDGAQWIEEQKLVASDGASADFFGQSLAIDGNRIVIGAIQNDSIGSAYVYRYEGAQWILEQKLQPYDGGYSDQFGNSVALDGAQIVVGSKLDDDLGNESGSAYVYQRDGNAWVLHSKLLSPDGSTNQLFGSAIAMDGDNLLIAAPHYEESNQDKVYAYTWDGTSWNHHQTLVEDGNDSWDRFGWDVALEDDVAVISAMSEDERGGASGSAYEYRLEGETWVSKKTLIASDTAQMDFFGNAVATNGTMTAVAAMFHISDAIRSGAVYLYEVGSTQSSDLDSLYIIRGTWLRGDLEALEESDDRYVKVYAEPRRRKFLAETWTAVSCPTASPSSMEVTVEVSSTKRHVETRIYLWNAVRGEWILMTAFPQSKRDVSVSLVGISSPAEYIYPGEGENLVFVRVKMTRSSSYGPFRMFQDHVDVTVFE